jgi:hypothetical protein
VANYAVGYLSLCPLKIGLLVYLGETFSVNPLAACVTIDLAWMLLKGSNFDYFTWSLKVVLWWRKKAVG